jgi:hypothetical protein
MANRLSDKTIERFWRKVEMIPFHDCWEWIGSNYGHTGYGKLFCSYLGTGLAHRISWMINVGAIPDGFLVCHSCDNRNCVNPKHLFLGSYKDNAIDASKKKRLAQQRKTHCPVGHAYSGTNLYLYKSGRGCRECRNIAREKSRVNMKSKDQDEQT